MIFSSLNVCSALILTVFASFSEGRKDKTEYILGAFEQNAPL